MANAARSHRVTASAIKRAVDGARSAGMDPAMIEIAPDGTVRVADARAVAKPVDEFSAWADRL